MSAAQLRLADGTPLTGWLTSAEEFDRAVAQVLQRHSRDQVQVKVEEVDVRQRLEAQGMELAADQRPEQLGAFIQAEVNKWRDVVKASGARVD